MGKDRGVEKAEGWREGEVGGTQSQEGKGTFGMPIRKGLCMGDQPALKASLSSPNCKFIVGF